MFFSRRIRTPAINVRNLGDPAIEIEEESEIV
jgi:hypothetical protein